MSGMRTSVLLVWIGVSWLGVVASVGAQATLHERIDQQIAAPPSPPLAPLCSDSEFLRRISLDLTGTVPTAAAVKAFLADGRPEKRAVWIDQLLASPQFARHMATTFDVMLMERRPDKHVKLDEWQKYLFDSFVENKSWDRLAREILNADGTDERMRGAAKFYLDRDGEPNLLTRDVGRMFFGMDLGCCQCHDHPLVDSYLQSDYYGLYAFVARGTLFTDKDKKVFYAEKAEGDAKFTSVFTKQQDETRPCLPGSWEIEEPVFLRGEEYTVAPADNVRPVPKYSRRSKLAELSTGGANRAFNRNIANRLWALMMGRGLVEPLDMHHRDNPATHPELLEILADEFVAMKFDIRALLREVALSQAYQRSLDAPPELNPFQLAAVEQLPQLEAQLPVLAKQIEESLAATETARKEYDTARKGVYAVLAELAAANNALAGARKAVDETAKALQEAQQQLSTKKDVATAVGDAATKAGEAAAKLAGDTEVAQAAEKFKTRAAQLAGEVVAAEKLVQERTPAAKSAADALAAAQAAAQGIVTKLQGVEQQAAAVRDRLQAATLRLRGAEQSRQVATVKKTRAQSLVKVAEVSAEATRKQQTLAGLRDEIAVAKKTMETLAAQLPALEQAAVAAKSAHEAAAKQVAETQAALQGKQQVAQVTAEALAKAEIAFQKLPQDAEIKQATEVLRSRRDKTMTEMAETQKVFMQHESAAKVAAEQRTVSEQNLATARTQNDALAKMLPEKEAALPAIQAAAEATATAAQVERQQATQTWSQQFGLGVLEPLSAEQMAWSILTVTGVAEQYRAAAIAEADKALPLDPNMPVDPAKLAARERLIEQQVFDKLKGNVATFVGLFGHAGGQPQRDFFATVDQALFFSNAGTVQSWLNPGGENLLGRLLKLPEPRQVAEELYVSVLARAPSGREVEEVAKYLQSRANDRQVALQEMAWALITSNEFRFSH